jgi:hypothetical protein
MTVREGILPSAMVPGLVTVRNKKDKSTQNLYPVDAKELLAAQPDEYELVDNGAIEAARLAATPLRSGMAAGIPDERIVAEVAGLEGRVVIADSEEDRDAIVAKGDNADAVPASSAPKSAPKAPAKEESKAPASSQGAGASDKK